MKSDISQNLKRGTDTLTKAGIDTAILDAEVLLAHATGLERIDLHLKKNRALTDDESAKFENFIARRAKKEPVAYITGFKEFWSLNIAVTRDVLIPRPETEGIVERALEIYQDSKIAILDLCTGSGCVAAALATEMPAAKITVADISSAAIEVAKRNLAFAGDRTRFLVGNLFEPLVAKQFDLVTANPPYIADGDFGGLDDDIRLYEPQVALTSGTDGLAIPFRIIQDAPKYLKAGGHLVMEMGMGQAEALWDLAHETGAYESMKAFEDYSGIERIFVAQRRG